MTESWHAAVSVFLPSTGRKDLDEWIASRRAAAIARIIKAVGKNPHDKDQLAADIFDACVEMRGELDPFEARKALSRHRKVQRIRNGIEKYVALIDSDPHISTTINKPLGVQLSAIKQLLFELSVLENSLARRAEKWHGKADLPVKLKNRRPSELEWLAGVSLPLVYERHFLRRAGRSRSAEGEVSGPAVRFIEATLKELGRPYRPESIARAFSRLTALRDGRREKKSG